MSEQRILGVDIGTEWVKVIELATDEKRSRVFVSAFTKFPLSTETPIFNALRDAVSKGGFKTKETIVNVQGPDVDVRFVVIRIRTEKNLLNVLKYELTKDGGSIDDFYMDHSKLTETPMPNGEKEVKILVALARKTLVDQIYNILDKADLVPAAVDCTSLATFNCLSFLRSIGASSVNNYAMVNFGPSEPIITIAKDDRPNFVRVLQSEGRDLMDLIRKKFMIDDKTQLIQFVVSPGDKGEELKDTISLKLEEFGREIRNTLEFYEGQEDVIVSDVFLCGGFASMFGVLETLKIQLPNRTVHISDPFASLDLELPEEQKKALLSDPAQAVVALGLAARMEDMKLRAQQAVKTAIVVTEGLPARYPSDTEPAGDSTAEKK